MILKRSPFIAFLEWKKSSKSGLIEAYHDYVKFHGLLWTKPVYRADPSLPRIPTEQIINDIIAEDESFVLAHLALARVYTKTGQHDLAIKHAEKACELEPQDSFNYTALSVTYQRAWAGTEDQQYIVKAEDAWRRPIRSGGSRTFTRPLHGA